MQKYGYRKTAECMLCQKARGSSRSGELPKETIGHIQSAGCLGQKEVVTAAHNACIRELLQEVNVHEKADRHMRLLTIETESRLGTLWDQEECNQFCSKEELWAAAMMMCCLLVFDSVTSTPQWIRQPRPRVYLRYVPYEAI